MQRLSGRLVTGGGRLQESTEPQEASSEKRSNPPPAWGVLPYMGYRYVPLWKYGFQVVYSRTGYINQGVWA